MGEQKLDLDNLDFGEIKESGMITVKTTMWAQKANWETIPLKDLEAYFSSLNPEHVETGKAGLYIKPYVDYLGARFFIPILDVEDKAKHHSSVQANITAAQNLFFILHDLGLAEDLIISLTGNGFRFNMPYLIPYSYADAFQEMIKDEMRFPSIDPSPQNNNSFFRLLAYRGNKVQNKDTKDVHIHLLKRSDQIQELTEDRYKTLVKGKPDITTYHNDIKNFIPKDYIPESWISILEDYKMQLLLRSTIATPRIGIFSTQKRVNMEQVLSYLDESGINYQKHEIDGDNAIYKLDTCPECGEGEGNPWVTTNGRLKCFRNSCPAGIKGLSARQWVEGYSPIEDEDPDYENKPGFTLAQAREKTGEAIVNALETGKDIVIGATMGVGKTHIAIEKSLLKATEKRILYTVPTKELAEDLFVKFNKKVKDANREIAIRHIEGRNEDNCQKISDISEVAQKGYTPAYIVCMGCNFSKNCPYRAQFQGIPKTGIIITTHSTANYHKEKIDPDIWILDENMLAHFFNIYRSSQKDMDKLREIEDDEVKPFFEALQETAEKVAPELNEYGEARFYVRNTPPGRWETAPTLEELNPELTKYFNNDLYPTNYSLHYMKDPENKAKWENITYKTDLQLQTVKFFDHLIYDNENAVAYIKIKLINNKASIEYIVFEYDPPTMDNCQIIHLDGTVYKPEIETLFPEDTDIVVVQVRLEDCKKIQIKSSRGKTKMQKLGHHQKKKDLEFLLGLLAPEDTKVLLITHKFCSREVLEIAKSLKPNIQFGTYHFWGPRGINTFEDFDACISYGTPTINSNSVSDQAMMLFDNEEEIATWEDHLRKSDLAQAVHRIRPVNGNKTIIIMGSYWPIEYLGAPDEKIDRMRKGESFNEAKTRLKIFAEHYGFINKSIAMLLNVAMRQEEEALYMIQEQINLHGGGGYLFVPTLINNIYKSEDKLKEGTPAIILRGNSSWKKLMGIIGDETDLPYMMFCPKGRGRSSLALGTPERVEAFCKLAGTQYDPSEYKMYSPN
jgi:hypothetical protein